MKISQLFEDGCSILKNADVENHRNEARWIFESVFDKEELEKEIRRLCKKGMKK